MKITRQLVLAIGLVCCLWGAGTIGTASAQGGDSPQACRRCHDAYFTWTESAHNTSAYRGERFQAVWARQRYAEVCLTCHTTGYNGQTGAVDYAGVSCAACHRPLPNGAPAGEDRDHPQKSIPGRAAACGTCHGNDHALTYTEWQASAHNGGIEVTCIDCHDPHSGHLVEQDIYTLCGDCHFEPIPPTSAHMGIEDGCTDCHPTPINDDNVHMHGGSEAAADCVACHMVTQDGPYGNFLADAGHTLQVSLAACTNCHGALHTMQPGSGSASPD